MPALPFLRQIRVVPVSAFARDVLSLPGETYNLKPQTMLNVREEMFPDCPIRNVLARISDKWSILVLLTLEERAAAVRFKELQRAVPDISQKALTHTLRTLEEDGYVTRAVFAEVPPRVEYALTPRAQSLLPRIHALVGWATEHFADILRDRRKAEAAS